jgi:AcrR family transcriptional regulator
MVKKSQPERLTQEERSANTRARLLKAVIESLYTRGYAATTTMVVLEDSGVSRGAMLHQFPSKVDLMLYVVRAVYEEELRLYREGLDAFSDPHERLLAFPEVAWKVLGRPAGVAVLEIIQGSRSDAELSRRLKPLQKEIEQDSFKQASALISGADVGASPVATRLVVWAIRGLSIASIVAEQPREVEKSVALLRDMLAVAIEAGLIPSSVKPAPASRRKRA